MQLSDFYNSDYFMAWDSDNRSCGGCGIIHDDPDRFNRIMEAAEDGADGSTHAEIISDWLDALNTLTIMDPEYDEPEECITNLDDGVISQQDYDTIYQEIMECESWHDKNGSLNDQLS